ncbi:hypothetical protein BGZ98_003087 [Dissophora globulifera]|nr:hypothetical protein BGZ98_003087 [Dissophora globulifera]
MRNQAANTPKDDIASTETIIDMPSAASLYSNTGETGSDDDTPGKNAIQDQHQISKSLNDEGDQDVNAPLLLFQRYFGDPEDWSRSDSEESDDNSSQENSTDDGSKEDIIDGQHSDEDGADEKSSDEDSADEKSSDEDSADEKSSKEDSTDERDSKEGSTDGRHSEDQEKPMQEFIFGERSFRKALHPISDGTFKTADKDNAITTTKENQKDAARGIVEYFGLVPYIQDDPSFTLIPLDPKIKMPLILVPPSLQGSEGDEIEAMDVSVDQKYAVTLSTNRWNRPTVDLWDVALTNDVEAGTPMASVPIDTMAAGDRSIWFGVCISSDGNYIAVFQRPNLEAQKQPSFSPLFFECVDILSTIKNGQQSPPVSHKKLKVLKQKLIPSLSTFVGDAKFQHLVPGNILPKDSQKHVFVTHSGHFLDVFDVSRDFQLLYTISLPSNTFGSIEMQPHLNLITTLQDEIFAWCNEYGEISIWNWRVAKCIEYIPTSDFYFIATSPDGSIMVGVTSEGIASIYSLASGLLLHTEDCRISKASGIMFSLNQVIVSGEDLVSGSEYCVIDLPNMSKVPFSFDTVFESRLFCILDQSQDIAPKRAIFCGKQTIEFVDVGISGNALGTRSDTLGTRGGALELWGLPMAEQSTCKLLAVVAVGTEIRMQDICHHGSILWKDRHDGPNLYFNTSRSSYRDTKDTVSLIQSIPSQVKQLKSFSATYKEALVELMLLHLNKNIEDDQTEETVSVVNERSVMWALISNTEVGTGLDSFIYTILNSHTFNHWVPQAYELSADPEQDMIEHLTSAYRISTANILINYCLARAHSDGLVFLERLLTSVPHIIPKYPEIALEIARRVAFFPARNRETALHHSVSNGILWRWDFWKSEQSDLYQLMDKNPVFHLLNRLSMTHGLLESERLKSLPALDGVICERNGDIPAQFYVAPFSLVWAIQMNGEPVSDLETGSMQAVTWIQWYLKLMRLVWHFIYPRDTVYIRTKYTDLAAFDNPAIMALMTYKWNRFARYFWSIRLLLQTVYEFIVLGVTFFQLYGDQVQRANLFGGYIAIFVLGYMLLHLEFQQMRGGLARYFSSLYNYVDLAAYLIPLVSSGILIASPESADALRALSFSMVIIYIHIIFELRVFKNVCKVATIVVNILLEIPAFFLILAIFILSFAHSINHLTEVNFRAADCPPDIDSAAPPSICNAQRSEFPKNYLQAVSATYFFMTGDYGPVATSLTDGHWTSQLMVGLFFFLTAVLMMNVVIALMNGVYSEAVITAQQTWLRNRVELVASAENLSYFLPYFQDQFDYFPKYVYYTATHKEVEDYQKKYGFDRNKLQFDFMPETNNRNTATIVTTPSSAAEVASISPLPVSVPAVEVPNQKSQLSSVVAVAGRIDKMDEIQSMVFEMKAKLDEVQDQLALEATRYEVQLGLRMAEMEERVAKERQASQIQVQQMIDVLADRLITRLQQHQ